MKTKTNLAEITETFTNIDNKIGKFPEVKWYKERNQRNKTCHKVTRHKLYQRLELANKKINNGVQTLKETINNHVNQ